MNSICFLQGFITCKELSKSKISQYCFSNAWLYLSSLHPAHEVRLAHFSTGDIWLSWPHGAAYHEAQRIPYCLPAASFLVREGTESSWAGMRRRGFGSLVVWGEVFTHQGIFCLVGH